MIKTCLVTGANRGLGLEITRALLAAGHRIVATSRSVANFDDNPKETNERDGSDRLHRVALDITDAVSVSRAIDDAIDRFGGIDVLVNSAGHAQLGYFEMTREDAIRTEFEVNLFGTMAVTRAVLPHMRERRSGQLITISSSSGLTSSAGGSIYSSSKFALEGWIEGLAQEIAPFGIRSLIIEPGMMRTDFLDPSSAKLGDIAVSDYAEAAAGFFAFIQGSNHSQLNDPAVLAGHLARLIDDPAPPIRFVFGEDALAWIGAKVDALRADLTRSAEIASKPVPEDSRREIL